MDPRKGDALWEVLAEMFGSKLTSQFGEECPRTWHKVLRHLDNDEIGRGVHWLCEEGRDWPPSASEFFRLCKKPRPPEPQYYVPLPAPECDPEVARMHLAAIREKLGMNKKDEVSDESE